MVAQARTRLPWMLTQDDDIIPIPCSRSIKHAEENPRSFELKLLPEDIDRVTKAIEQAETTVG